MERKLLATLFIMNLLIAATLASCTAVATPQDQSRIFVKEGTNIISINPRTGASHRWEVSGYSAGISPDGKQFAYCNCTQEPPMMRVWVSDTAGTNARKIMEYPDIINCDDMHQSMTWSDDGRQIGFIYGNRSFIVDVATGEWRFYTLDPVRFLAWRPRHSRQFCAYVDIRRDGNPSLFLYDPERETYQLLSDQLMTGVAWSPDGARLAFSTNAAELVVMDLASFERNVVYASAPTDYDYFEDFTWSPDGQSIVLHTSNGNIMLVDPEGAAARLISEDGYPAARGQPLWSPNGQRIAYMKRNQETGVPSLVVVDVASGSQRVLATDLSWGVELLAWR